MSMGQQCQLEFYELHSVAADTHIEYMLSAEYKGLQEPIKQLFKQHLAEHLNYIQQQQINQQMAQQNTQPTGQNKKVDINEG